MDPLTTSLLSTAAQQGLGAATGQSSQPMTSGDISDRSVVKISPVGVNLGAILQPYNQGSEANGGFALDLLSRYAPGATSQVSTLVASDNGNLSKILLPLLIGIGLFALYRFI